MKKTLFACLAVLLILSQYALAEASYATDTVLLSLSDSWTDVSSIDKRVDAVFMNPDGLLLYIQVDKFESQMSGSEQAESVRDILNSADDQVLMAMLQYSFGQRLQELDSNPQIHTADMAAGLVGCYCTVNMDDTLLTFANAASSEEEWFMIMGNANSTAASNGPVGATELETLMADILGSMTLNRKRPRPSFPYPDNSAEAPTAAAERKPTGTIVISDVIDALGEENYRIAYEALKSGDVIQKGRRSDANRGIQQMLAAFGQKISVDGSVGSKTIAALNAVQEAFGLEKTDTLDLAGFEKLLPLLLISTDPDKADALVKGTLTDGEYQYMQACASMAQGKYYSARLTFQKSRYGDWEQRMSDCVQKWPKTGALYKNPSVPGSSAQFRMKINSKAPDEATFVKVYTADGVLARTMFIGGSGTATTSLPGGTYVIRYANGKNWYGETEAFGREGYYAVLTYEDGSMETKISKNYRQTITMNVETKDPSAGNVDTENINWEEF